MPNQTRSAVERDAISAIDAYKAAGLRIENNPQHEPLQRRI